MSFAHKGAAKRVDEENILDVGKLHKTPKALQAIQASKNNQVCFCYVLFIKTLEPRHYKQAYRETTLMYRD